MFVGTGDSNRRSRENIRPDLLRGSIKVTSDSRSSTVKAPEKWWLEDVGRLITFLLGPGNFSGAMLHCKWVKKDNIVPQLATRCFCCCNSKWWSYIQLGSLSNNLCFSHSRLSWTLQLHICSGFNRRIQYAIEALHLQKTWVTVRTFTEQMPKAAFRTWQTSRWTSKLMKQKHHSFYDVLNKNRETPGHVVASSAVFGPFVESQRTSGPLIPTFLCLFLFLWWFFLTHLWLSRCFLK